MKTPLVIMLIIVVAILGFLVVYSQQHGMTGTAPGEHGAASGGYGGGSVARGVDYGTMVVIGAVFGGILLWNPIKNTFGKKK